MLLSLLFAHTRWSNNHAQGSMKSTTVPLRRSLATPSIPKTHHPTPCRPLSRTSPSTPPPTHAAHIPPSPSTHHSAAALERRKCAGQARAWGQKEPAPLPPAQQDDSRLAPAVHFDLQLGVTLAGAAFEAYLLPTGSTGLQQRSFNGSQITFTDKWVGQRVRQLLGVRRMRAADARFGASSLLHRPNVTVFMTALEACSSCAHSGSLGGVAEPNQRRAALHRRQRRPGPPPGLGAAWASTLTSRSTPLFKRQPQAVRTAQELSTEMFCWRPRHGMQHAACISRRHGAAHDQAAGAHTLHGPRLPPHVRHHP